MIIIIISLHQGLLSDGSMTLREWKETVLLQNFLLADHSPLHSAEWQTGEDKTVSRMIS